MATDFDPRYTPMAPYVAPPAPVSPSAQQLFEMNQQNLRPAFQAQQSQMEQAQRLLQAQIDLQRQTQQQAAQQFMYANPPWTAQAGGYLNTMFPQYGVQTLGAGARHPLAAAAARRGRGGVNNYIGGGGGAPVYVGGAPSAVAQAVYPSQATSSPPAPGTAAWTPPVSVEQARQDQMAVAGLETPLATAAAGYMPTSQGTFYAGSYEDFAGTPQYPAGD